MLNAGHPARLDFSQCIEFVRRYEGWSDSQYCIAEVRIGSGNREIDAKPTNAVRQGPAGMRIGASATLRQTNRQLFRSFELAA